MLMGLLNKEVFLEVRAKGAQVKMALHLDLGVEILYLVDG